MYRFYSWRESVPGLPGRSSSSLTALMLDTMESRNTGGLSWVITNPKGEIVGASNVWAASQFRGAQVHEATRS